MSIKKHEEKPSSCDGEPKEEVVRDFPDKLPAPGYKYKLDWFYVIFFSFVHLGSLYGLTLSGKSPLTTFYVIIFGTFMFFGTTVGAHRLFAHKCYKANAKLKIMLLTMQSFNLQRSMYTWVRDHRIHHKFTDTNADPHNSCRGFFFSHIGWLLVKPHPDVKKFGISVEKNDLKADPYVMFQNRNHIKLAVSTIIVSTFIPWFFWGESLKVSFFYGFLFRYMVSLHFTWFVNSAAHVFGTKPYDINITACDFNLISFITTGEGFHNYHHTFPWDYKTAESGKYSLNWSTAFIDFMAKIGWASDMKTVSDDLIRKRILRTGPEYNSQCDVNANFHKENFLFDTKNSVWGWDDPANSAEDKKLALILRKTISAD